MVNAFRFVWPPPGCLYLFLFDKFSVFGTLQPPMALTDTEHSPDFDTQNALEDSSNRGVTVRAISVGLIVTCLVNLLPAYSAYIVHSSRMVFAHLPMAAMVVFTAVAWPLNALAGSINRSWALRRGEMVVVFCMAWISASIPAANFMGLLIGGIAAPYYYATPENRWAELLLDYLPSWAVPTNRADEMTWFFEGKPAEAAIPWDAWIGPLIW